MSSQHWDIPGIVIEERTGYLAPERDVDGICNAFGRLLHNWKAWPKMLAESRAHVEREFDARRQGQALAQIYEDMVHPNRCLHSTPKT